jgi:hypothetical protein
MVTPRLFGNWRLVSRLSSAVAAPPEGRVSRHQLGAGMMYDGSDVETIVYAGYSWGSLPQNSANLEVNWQVNDQWSVSTAVEVNSLETPIRALLADISGNVLRVGANWRRDERLEVSSSLRWLSLSDGNDAVGGGVSLVSLLYTTPRLALRGRVDAFASRNTQPGGPYFAPEQDGSLAAGLAAEHILWRRYQRVFTQVVSFDAGIYAQKGFDTNWIGVFRYEHRWRQDPWTEIFYGIGYARRVFDGEAQREFSLSLGIRQRFG